MQNMKNERHRPTISDNPNVGSARHSIYKDAIDRYHMAMDSGFYIEAISLMESLISDRIESLLNACAERKNTDDSKRTEYSYQPLGSLVASALKAEDIRNYQPMVEEVNKIKDWKTKRNGAIHEMAKLSDTKIGQPFSEKYANLKCVAEEGYRLFRELDKELMAGRKNNVLA